jgi:hypothetical protein
LKDGDRVVFDWSGYTIGYFGRPFEAKGWVLFSYLMLVWCAWLFLTSCRLCFALCKK